MDRKTVGEELGVTRTTVDRIFRLVPVIQLPGERKVYVRRVDVEALLETHTYDGTRVRPSRWTRGACGSAPGRARGYRYLGTHGFSLTRNGLFPITRDVTAEPGHFIGGTEGALRGPFLVLPPIPSVRGPPGSPAIDEDQAAAARRGQR